MSAEIVSRDEIETFFADRWIDEVLFTVKSGKEATVYCCKAAPGRGESYFALKVYKKHQYRDFRNTALYQEGRLWGGARVARAFHNKSRFGREVERADWLGNEFRLLNLLSEAGAAVPRPVAVADNAILLDFIGEEDRPAPQLATLRLTPFEAEALLEQALTSIEIMLAHHIVHGDLSAYNLLIACGRLAVIDFPQAVDARTNPMRKYYSLATCGMFAATSLHMAPMPAPATMPRNCGTCTCVTSNGLIAEGRPVAQDDKGARSRQGGTHALADHHRHIPGRIRAYLYRLEHAGGFDAPWQPDRIR